MKNKDSNMRQNYEPQQFCYISLHSGKISYRNYTTVPKKEIQDLPEPSLILFSLRGEYSGAISADDILYLHCNLELTNTFMHSISFGNL
jgi:hypothetical protein